MACWEQDIPAATESASEAAAAVEGVFQVLSDGEKIEEEEKRAAAAAPPQQAEAGVGEEEAGEDLSEAQGSVQITVPTAEAAPQPEQPQVVQLPRMTFSSSGCVYGKIDPVSLYGSSVSAQHAGFSIETDGSSEMQTPDGRKGSKTKPGVFRGMPDSSSEVHKA